MTSTTKGVLRVRVGFNPSEREDVNALKNKGAIFIDSVEAIDEGSFSGRRMSETQEQAKQREIDAKFHSSEIRRLKSLAQTKIEEATMWAVKAATYSK